MPVDLRACQLTGLSRFIQFKLLTAHSGVFYVGRFVDGDPSQKFPKTYRVRLLYFIQTYINTFHWSYHHELGRRSTTTWPTLRARWRRLKGRRELENTVEGFVGGQVVGEKGGLPIFFPNLARWWFQILFICTLIPGDFFPIWRAYFSNGWFNHQLAWKFGGHYHIVNWNLMLWKMHVYIFLLNFWWVSNPCWKNNTVVFIP